MHYKRQIDVEAFALTIAGQSIKVDDVLITGYYIMQFDLETPAAQLHESAKISE